MSVGSVIAGVAAIIGRIMVLVQDDNDMKGEMKYLVPTMERLQVVLNEVAKCAGEGPRTDDNAVLKTCLEQLDETLKSTEKLITRWKKSSTVMRVMKSTRFKQKYSLQMARLQQALSMLNGANLNMNRQTKDEVEKVGKQLSTLDVHIDTKMEETYGRVEDMIAERLGPQAIKDALVAAGFMPQHGVPKDELEREKSDLESMLNEARLQKEKMEEDLLSQMMAVIEISDSGPGAGSSAPPPAARPAAKPAAKPGPADDAQTLDCGICCDTFTAEGERTPRMLPCGHTVCESCCGRHFIRHMECPLCRTPVQARGKAKETAAQLPKNFYVIRMLEDEAGGSRLARKSARAKASPEAIEKKLRDGGMISILEDLDLMISKETLVNCADELGVFSVRDFAEEIDSDMLEEQGMRKVPARKIIREARLRAGLEQATEEERREEARRTAAAVGGRAGGVSCVVVTSSDLAIAIAKDPFGGLKKDEFAKKPFQVSAGDRMDELQEAIQRDTGVAPSLQRLWLMAHSGSQLVVDRPLDERDLRMTVGELAASRHPPGNLTIFLELTEGYVSFLAKESLRLLFIKTYDPVERSIRLVRAVAADVSAPVESIAMSVGSYLADSPFPTYSALGAPGSSPHGVLCFREHHSNGQPALEGVQLHASIGHARFNNGDFIIVQQASHGGTAADFFNQKTGLRATVPDPSRAFGAAHSSGNWSMGVSSPMGGPPGGGMYGIPSGPAPAGYPSFPAPFGAPPPGRGPAPPAYGYDLQPHGGDTRAGPPPPGMPYGGNDRYPNMGYPPGGNQPRGGGGQRYPSYGL
ncbi:unnamed protein product [Pedinophyceae sp. YPF-701]|nr:unnamed protein product [Pedinophyceae sp. YPF-701]